MRCTFEDAEIPNVDGWRKVRCTRCGFVSAPTPHTHDRIFRTCDKLGLGDYAAFGLAAFGITKERVAWMRGLFGEPSCGGCEQRQAALNELGKKVGL